MPTTDLIPMLPYILLSLPLLHLLYTHTSNPLRLIPAAHPLAPWTSLWIAYIRWRGRENATLKDAHARYGAVVCLGPREVSVNCVVGGIREVYAGGFAKGEEGGEEGRGEGFNWYAFFGNYGGIPNMFSTGANKPHSTRKRMLSNIYSKSTILSSPPLLTSTHRILATRFLPLLATPPPPFTPTPSTPTILNITPIINAATMDIVTAYIFGLASSSNLLQKTDELMWFLDLYNSRRSFNFWPQEFPRVTAWVGGWWRLVPRWVDEANGGIERWTLGMCEGAAGVVEALQEKREGGETTVEVQDVPVVYQQLSTSIAKDVSKKTASPSNNDDVTETIKLTVASELLDHLAAGFDTSSITLTYAIHELSTHPAIQSELRRELLSLTSPPSSLPPPKTIDALPFLNAVVHETLRLHPAIPGPQPRVTPPQGCKLGDGSSGVLGGGGEYYVPGGVRVSASAGLLHMNEEVFEEPEEWRPERWLGKEGLSKEGKRWFWAFGSGGRMCIGSHLALYQMKYILYSLYTTYATSIVDDTGIEQIDAYTAPPASDQLIIKLTKV
ncbi:cytochrome P450 [Periconia macrospinosa]|uniref:Cytochrome P450 n=1 Tax=Periconia macrospinosa TaxID=97972 RepID=A0A2V1DQA0_9PLEO|nr:cytochrome P450 [Periconia macrospinosa]